jgi:hypothetical protein
LRPAVTRERVIKGKIVHLSSHKQEERMRVLVVISGLACACALIFAGCAGPYIYHPVDPTYTYSFEDGLDGWTAKAFDIEVGGEDVDWSIETSTDRATAGTHAVQYHVNNLTDAAKIFLEREFTLDPGTYTLSLDFDFATADFGDMNLWQFIAGVSKAAAASPEDLHYLGDTGNGHASDDGFVWLDKTFTNAQIEDSTVTVAAGEQVYVQLGVWGTWETERTYYLDNLTVKFTRQP